MYQVRKGWPSQAAIDEAFEAAAGQNIKEGMVVQLSNGKASIVNKPTGNIAFVISREPLKKTFTGVMSQLVIEFKNELEPLPDGSKAIRNYFDPAATFVAGDGLTYDGTNNYFVKAASGDTPIARVLDKKTDGTLRINWFGAM